CSPRPEAFPKISESWPSTRWTVRRTWRGELLEGIAHGLSLLEVPVESGADLRHQLVDRRRGQRLHTEHETQDRDSQQVSRRQLLPQLPVRPLDDLHQVAEQLGHDELTQQAGAALVGQRRTQQREEPG